MDLNTLQRFQLQLMNSGMFNNNNVSNNNNINNNTTTMNNNNNNNNNGSNNLNNFNGNNNYNNNSNNNGSHNPMISFFPSMTNNGISLNNIFQGGTPLSGIAGTGNSSISVSGNNNVPTMSTTAQFFPHNNINNNINNITASYPPQNNKNVPEDGSCNNSSTNINNNNHNNSNNDMIPTDVVSSFPEIPSYPIMNTIMMLPKQQPQQQPLPELVLGSIGGGGGKERTINTTTTISSKGSSSSQQLLLKVANGIEPFPEKLHRLLRETEALGQQDIISFVGTNSFQIKKPEIFFKDIVPKYFRQTRLSSFKRQLKLYGFHLITLEERQPSSSSSSSSSTTKNNCGIGVYQHDLFVRDRPELCRRMRRVAVKSSPSSSSSTVRII